LAQDCRFGAVHEAEVQHALAPVLLQALLTEAVHDDVLLILVHANFV
jgi:hypothetical protein